MNSVAMKFEEAALGHRAVINWKSRIGSGSSRRSISL